MIVNAAFVKGNVVHVDGSKSLVRIDIALRIEGPQTLLKEIGAMACIVFPYG